MFAVAPFAGAWIEIDFVYCDTDSCKVAPFAGAWIEIIHDSIARGAGQRRSLRGSVD